MRDAAVVGARVEDDIGRLDGRSRAAWVQRGRGFGAWAKGGEAPAVDLNQTRSLIGAHLVGEGRQIDSVMVEASREEAGARIPAEEPEHLDPPAVHLHASTVETASPTARIRVHRSPTRMIGASPSTVRSVRRNRATCSNPPLPTPA